MIKPLMTKKRSTPLLPNTVTPCGNPAIFANTSKWTTTTKSAASARSACTFKSKLLPSKGSHAPRTRRDNLKTVISAEGYAEKL
jgi:hypothetical protein